MGSHIYMPVVYTVMGGLKAVIYNGIPLMDYLMAGINVLGIPISYNFVGWLGRDHSTLPQEFFSSEH